MKKLLIVVSLLSCGVFAVRADVPSRDLPRSAEFSEVHIGGELAERLARNFDRMEEKKYLPDNVFLTMAQSGDWPGDTEGRTILALVMDAQATGREPQHLKTILARLDEKINERGYMGPVLPGVLHEQQLSGNGWLLAGLCEHYRWTKDAKSLAAAKRIVENLFLPGRGHYATYPIDPAERFKDRGGASGNIVQKIGPWQLSTDIGCVFIGMDGLIRAYEFFPTPEVRACVEEMAGRFLQIDPLAIRAQAHATLTALRGLLRLSVLTGEKRWRNEAEHLFGVYERNGMTENFENYNWFERFSAASETCAVVDSYMVANELWRQTGKVRFLELAERIYWNAICRLQHRNGGFGLDTCPGKGLGSAELSVSCEEAHWCCTMRGAEGLATAARSSCFVQGSEVLICSPRAGTYALAVPGGTVRLSCSGTYPFGSSLTIELLDDLPPNAQVKVFRPSWTNLGGVRVNDAPAVASERGGFLCVSGARHKGDRICFNLVPRNESIPLQVPRNALGANTVRKTRGPFVLGQDANGVIKPVYHLMDPGLWKAGSGRVRIVFPNDGENEKVDPRTRTFVMPTRIVWTTEEDTGLAYGKRSTVTNAASLLDFKFGQVPENGWNGSQPGAKAKECQLVNQGVRPGLILDFGRERHGGLSLCCGVKTPRGSQVRIRFGESVSETCADIGEDGATNDHAIRDGIYTVPNMGVLEIGNTGFRFVRIDLVTPGTLPLESVRAISLMRPMERLGAFRSSDERLNRIWETAVHTVHLCCQDYLWDGIKRDRMIWMGDTHPETMTILNVFGGASVLIDSLEEMVAVTPPNEWMNHMSPYTFWFLRNMREWWFFTGDRASLERHHDYLRQTFNNIMRHVSSSNTLVGVRRPFLDWPTEHNRPAVHAGMHALALTATRTCGEMAEALGDRDWAADCQQLARRLETVRPRPEGSKQAAALLALSRLREPKEMFVEMLGKNGHKGVSTFYGYYMLEAMVAADERQRALDTVRDFWGGMLDYGATSFWENFDLAWTNNAFRIDERPVAGKTDIHGAYGEFCYPGFRHSLCHGWAGGPAAWLINHVLGVRPVEAGCRTVEVKPFLGDLEWAEGAMALPGGRSVRVRVRRGENGVPDVQVEAPPDVRILR